MNDKMLGWLSLSVVFVLLAAATASLDRPGNLPLAFGGIAVFFALCARYWR